MPDDLLDVVAAVLREGAVGQPAHEFFLIHRQSHDNVDSLTRGRCDVIELLDLRERARVPVEEPARPCVGLCEAVAHPLVACVLSGTYSPASR